MSKAILTRIDSPEENEVHLSPGEVTIGRGSILGCDDKRISRNHGYLLVSDTCVTLVSKHSNPCFYKLKDVDTYTVLTKEQKKSLVTGDEFSLLPNSFCYRVGFVKTDVENIVPGSSAQTTPPAKRRRVLPGWLTDLPGNEPSVLGTVAVSSSPTAAASRKRKAPVTDDQTAIKEAPSDQARPIDQAGAGSVEPIIDHLKSETNEPIDQVKSEIDEPTDQVAPGSPEPVDQSGPGSAKPAKDGYEDVYGGTATAASRETCVYGATCYRKNPQHRVEFSHPGDADYRVNPGLPECPYGTACYRKNLQHRRDFAHTRSPPASPAPAPAPAPATPTRARRRPRTEAADDSEDDYDLDDPFLNDASSDDYRPTSSEDEDENEDEDEDEESQEGRRMLREAKKFTRKKKK